jgi:membrane-bound metal-dependent hydrolase YbcI (DUF457 family)
MLGTTHAASGWCAGLALAPALGAHTLPQAVVLATITAGSALLPDLDHPGSRASRLLYVVTGALSAVVQTVSRSLYRLTRGRADEYCDGGHRHFTHTLVFAVLLGAGVNWWVSSARTWALVAVLVLAVMLTVDAFGDWFLPIAAGAVLIAAIHAEEMAAISSWLGVAVAAGCLVHCLGDALTETGCPFLWPLPILGETWYELRPPAFLRFRTGGPAELALLLPAFTVLGVLLLPGATGFLAGLVS